MAAIPRHRTVRMLDCLSGQEGEEGHSIDTPAPPSLGALAAAGTEPEQLIVCRVTHADDSAKQPFIPQRALRVPTSASGLPELRYLRGTRPVVSRFKE